MPDPELTEAAKEIKKIAVIRRASGIVFVCLSFVTGLVNHYFIKEPAIVNTLCFSVTFLLVAGLLMVIPYEAIPFYIFDVGEYKTNKTEKTLVYKIRCRALLFNNVSVIIFFFTLIVILAGFYMFFSIPENTSETASISIRLGVTVLLIFLVQLLFRVFKYLLRVAAFYNAKADAIEFWKMNPTQPLDKLMEVFTPDQYDISDLPQPTFSENPFKK
jgi:membrane protein YdbS with pleckstrin-like domain